MNPSEIFLASVGDLSSDVVGALLTVVASPQLNSFVVVLRGLFVIVSIILAVLIVLLFLQANIFSSWKRKYYDWYQPADTEKRITEISEAWQSIVDHFEHSPGPQSWQEAVVAADKILYFALGELDFAGATITEKLYHVTPAEIRNLGEVISAHKAASTFSDNLGATISYERAAEIIAVYGTALQELGVITQSRQ